MDRADIESVTAALDAAVPKEDARVVIRQYGGGLEECSVVGNERGYLRLGIEMLKAASRPTGFKNSRDAVDADVHYLLRNSQVQLDWFERREAEDCEINGSSKAGGIVGLLIGFALVAVFVVGCATVGRWAYETFVAAL